MEIEFRLASLDDIDDIVALVGHYHQLELIESSPEQRRNAIKPVLSEDSELGFILVATLGEKILGYIVICYSYSIEIGGRDAFIDELYILETMRDKGIGSKLLEETKTEAKKHEVKALHLEVTKSNTLAKTFYQQNGFSSRDRYHLMHCHLK